jgi:hypothetical protein
MKIFGHLHCPGICSVSNGYLSHPAADKVFCRKIRHFPGSYEENIPPFESAEYLLCKFHSGKADGHRVVGNSRFRSHSLGHPERMMEDLVQYDTGRVMLYGRAERILDLAQNLWFSHNHGVDARCHAEQMAHRFMVKVQIKAFVHLLHRQIAVMKNKGPQPFHSALTGCGICQYLHAVASGEI